MRDCGVTELHRYGVKESFRWLRFAWQEIFQDRPHTMKLTQGTSCELRFHRWTRQTVCSAERFRCSPASRWHGRGTLPAGPSWWRWWQLCPEAGQRSLGCLGRTFWSSREVWRTPFRCWRCHLAWRWSTWGSHPDPIRRPVSRWWWSSRGSRSAWPCWSLI